MKKLFIFASLISLVTVTGCIVPEGERRDHYHARYEGHRDEVIVGPPVVVVRPAEVIVR